MTVAIVNTGLAVALVFQSVNFAAIMATILGQLIWKEIVAVAIIFALKRAIVNKGCEGPRAETSLN